MCHIPSSVTGTLVKSSSCADCSFLISNVNDCMEGRSWREQQGDHEHRTDSMHSGAGTTLPFFDALALGRSSLR